MMSEIQKEAAFLLELVRIGMHEEAALAPTPKEVMSWEERSSPTSFVSVRRLFLMALSSFSGKPLIGYPRSAWN